MRVAAFNKGSVARYDTFLRKSTQSLVQRGMSLNGHVHFHVCVVDGVFEEVVGDHWTFQKRVFANGRFFCIVTASPG